MNEYKCIILKVVDGDTVDVDIDLGFGVWLRDERVRIKGIDAPETRTRDLVEKARGYESKDFVAKVLPVGSVQTLKTFGFKGKFGRILGDFVIYDTVTDSHGFMGSIMIREGLASLY